MAANRRKFDQDFKAGAVRIARETGKSTRRWPGSSGSTRARWVTGAPRSGGGPAATMS